VSQDGILGVGNGGMEDGMGVRDETFFSGEPVTS